MDALRLRSSRSALAVLVGLALCVGVSAPAAIAQSAGDRQYVDPLANPDPPPAPDEGASGGGDGGGGGPDGSAGGTAPSQPDSTRAAPVESLDETIPVAPDVAGAQPAAAETLPRTGAEPAPLAAIGLALLAAGALARRRGTRHARA